MPGISLTKLAHQIIAKHLRSGDFAVDATLGNGRDTLFLANCVGDYGHVYGFDIQLQAVIKTRQYLENAGFLERTTLFNVSHALMDHFLPKELAGKFRVFMFNLGYLPGAEKTIITQTESTLAALKLASELLSTEAVITVIAYPGHPGGNDETHCVAEWCRNLDRNHFIFESFGCRSLQNHAPQLFVIRKYHHLLS
jgi:hypothetical protein